MALKCKKGDLAIILDGAYAGSIVEVLEFVGDGFGINSEGRLEQAIDAWRVSKTVRPKGFHAVSPVDFYIIEDRSLQPLPPESALNEEIKEAVA